MIAIVAADTSERGFGATLAISFSVPGEVVPWARAGQHGKVRFTPKKQRHYGAVIKDLCERAMGDCSMMDGPVELSIVATYVWPKSMTKKKRALPWAVWKETKPDADNIAKIVKDAIKLVAWRDDAQVASSHVWKKYGDKAGLTVRIRSLMEGADAARANEKAEVRVGSVAGMAPV